MSSINSTIFARTKEWAHPLRQGFVFGQDPVDFTETLFFGSMLPSRSGVYSGSFYLSDLVTQYRISADCFDQFGKIGYGEVVINTQTPVDVTFDMPTLMV